MCNHPAKERVLEKAAHIGEEIGRSDDGYKGNSANGGIAKLLLAHRSALSEEEMGV